MRREVFEPDRKLRPAVPPTHALDEVGRCVQLVGERAGVPGGDAAGAFKAGVRMDRGADTLEALFQSELTDFLLSPEEMDAHHAAASDMLREKQALIDTAEAELKKLLAAENELFELYHAGQIAKGDFGRHHKPLSERRHQIEDELPRLEAERDILKIGMLSRDEVLDDAKDLAVRWPQLPWEHRRQIVETITDRIIIGKEGVEISLLQIPFGNDGELATEPLGPGSPLRCGRDDGLFCGQLIDSSA